MLLPVAPGVSCLSVDALQTRSSKLPPSPAVSRCLPLSPNVYNRSKFNPNPHPQLLQINGDLGRSTVAGDLNCAKTVGVLSGIWGLGSTLVSV